MKELKSCRMLEFEEVAREDDFYSNTQKKSATHHAYLWFFGFFRGAKTIPRHDTRREEKKVREMLVAAAVKMIKIASPLSLLSAALASSDRSSLVAYTYVMVNSGTWLKYKNKFITLAQNFSAFFFVFSFILKSLTHSLTRGWIFLLYAQNVRIFSTYCVCKKNKKPHDRDHSIKGISLSHTSEWELSFSHCRV